MDELLYFNVKELVNAILACNCAPGGFKMYSTLNGYTARQVHLMTKSVSVIYHHSILFAQRNWPPPRLEKIDPHSARNDAS